MFHRFRSSLSIIVLPLQYIVDTPIKLTRWLGDSVSTQHELIDENARLRAHELLLESRLQRLISLENENEQLRELLKSSSHVGGKAIVAQMLAVAMDPELKQVIINKGSNKKVYIGQPVLDAYGVLGQVVSVGLLTSKVLLTTDPKSAVPVRDSRNGLRAIAVGMGGTGKLAVINVPDTSDLQEGDLFVASGFGLRFPVGYPVGTVVKVSHNSGARFAEITLQPAAHLNRSEQVLLAWPSNVKLEKSVQKQLDADLPHV